MKTAILSVGTELLFGQIVNTNTVFLSQQLNLLGYDVMYHHTVGDNPGRLKEMIVDIYKECDLIITTGGLGPTQDDLTKEMVCELFGDHLVVNERELKKLEACFGQSGLEMTEGNRKQAYYPSNARIFENSVGTAAGFALEKDGKIIICMPGPPKEMNPMYFDEVKPYLESKQDSVIFYRTIRTFGIGESKLENKLIDLVENQTDPTIAPYVKEGETTLRIASKRSTLEEAEAAVADMIEKIKERAGKYIYSCDDEQLKDVVARKLVEKGLKISCAESCTGGLFAGKLIDYPGISAAFDRGFVTYTNESKHEELGVSLDTLEKFGAVSEQTAIEMARGVYNKTGSDICISVTGIAGPDGGTPEKPVGLIYIGVNYSDVLEGGNGDKRIEKYRRVQMRNFSRSWNRNYATLCMLDIVNKIIEGNTEILQ